MKTLPPVNFGPCRQTVTLYHRLPGPAFACTRTLFHGAFFDASLNRRTDPRGGSYETCFLLVLPSGWQGRPAWLEPGLYNQDEAARPGRFTLCPGDLVLEGEGPLLPDAAAWAALSAREQAGVVKETALRRINGLISHLEAGGPQGLGRSGLPHPRKGSFG